LAAFNVRGGGGAQVKKILAILLIPMIVNAEPGPATQYLINEPATLLDVGMMRLETLTTEFEKRVGLHWTNNDGMRMFKAEIHPHYDREDDRIYVYLSARNSEPTNTQMAEGCQNAMHQLNIWLLKSLPGLFLHTGYDDPSIPSDFYPAIKEMFELRCSFSVPTTGEGRFWATRTLGLLGDREMTIGKWKMRN
jgi:hypothetical protein